MALTVLLDVVVIVFVLLLRVLLVEHKVALHEWHACLANAIGRHLLLIAQLIFLHRAFVLHVYVCELELALVIFRAGSHQARSVNRYLQQFRRLYGAGIGFIARSLGLL